MTKRRRVRTEEENAVAAAITEKKLLKVDVTRRNVIPKSKF